MRTKNLAGLYGLAPLEWETITDRLGAGIAQGPGSGGPDHHTCWLVTVNRDGSPHVAGVGALWEEDTFWFVSGDRTRKGRNLARDPRCAMSVSTTAFDLVVNGEARKVVDPAVFEKMARRWATQGWPASVDASGQALTAEYSAPSAGPPPWAVYRLALDSATALSAEGTGGATRWFFDEP